MLSWLYVRQRANHLSENNDMRRIFVAIRRNRSLSSDAYSGADYGDPRATSSSRLISRAVAE